MGKVTLSLNQVPWDQALDLVLSLKGLSKRFEGGVLHVAPTAEFSSIEYQRLEQNKQLSELSPLYQELIPIKYADAKEIAAVFNSGTTDSLLSSRGSIGVFENHNMLLLRDTRSKIEELKSLIMKLDVQVPQIMIEARIVVMDNINKNAFGIQWHTPNQEYRGSSSDSSEAPINEVSAYDGTQKSVGFDSPPLSLINLGLSDSNSKFNVGFLGKRAQSLFRATMQALVSKGMSEIISEPKIITLNKKKGLIKSGEEIAFDQKNKEGEDYSCI